MIQAGEKTANLVPVASAGDMLGGRMEHGFDGKKGWCGSLATKDLRRENRKDAKNAKKEKGTRKEGKDGMERIDYNLQSIVTAVTLPNLQS